MSRLSVVEAGAGREHTLSLYGRPEDSLVIRDRLDALVKKGSGRIAVGFGGNPKDSSAVRGGPAFELIFNIHQFLKNKGVRDTFRLTMFAPIEKPGIRLDEKALEGISRFLERLNISRRFGITIENFDRNGIVFVDGSRLNSDLTMFIPAGQGHPVFAGSDLPLSDAGFILINDHCQVQGFDRVFAIGDSASLDGPAWRAKQGQGCGGQYTRSSRRRRTNPGLPGKNMHLVHFGFRERCIPEPYKRNSPPPGSGLLAKKGLGDLLETFKTRIDPQDSRTVAQKTALLPRMLDIPCRASATAWSNMRTENSSLHSQNSTKEDIMAATQVVRIVFM